MEPFKLINLVLYSKGKYIKGNIWEDLKKILEGDDYTPGNNNDVFLIISGNIQRWLLKSTINQEYKFSSFLDNLDPKQCWKCGYYTKEYPYVQLNEAQEFATYDYRTAVLYSALSVLSLTDRNDLGWNPEEPWPLPNEKVLPLSPSYITKTKENETIIH